MSAIVGAGDCPSPVSGVEVCPPSWSEDPQYQGMTSYFGGEAPLPTWIGYLTVLGFGAFFTVFTSTAFYLDRKFSGNATVTSEWFK